MSKKNGNKMIQSKLLMEIQKKQQQQQHVKEAPKKINYVNTKSSGTPRYLKKWRAEHPNAFLESIYITYR